MLLFILSFLTITALSLGQFNQVFTINGIQPNLALVFLIVYAFFEKDWLRRSALVLLAVFILNFEPVINFQTLFLILVFFISVAMVDYFRWQPPLNAVLVSILATLLINLDPFNFWVMIAELKYNLAALAVFSLFVVFMNSRFPMRQNV